MKNIPHENFITDEQLLIFLDNKEAGKSFPDALAQISPSSFNKEETDVLKTFWNMHGDLQSEAHNISPNKALTLKILDQMSAPVSGIVTNQINSGYVNQSAEGQVINSKYNVYTIMQMNWKIVAPIAVLVIVVAASMSMGSKEPATLAVNNEAPNAITTESGAAMTAQNVPVTGTTETSGSAMMAIEKKQSPAVAVQATGDVDTLVTSLLAEADGDKNLLDDASSDISLVTADSQSITDFNTTYNETTF